MLDNSINSQLQGDEDDVSSEGFWREFFLLRPDKASLQRILDDLSPDDLLHYQVRAAVRGEKHALTPFRLSHACFSLAQSNRSRPVRARRTK